MSLCRGCKASCLGEHILEHEGKIYNCPCLTCMVKVTCMEICEDFYIFRKAKDDKEGSLWPTSRMTFEDSGHVLIKYWSREK